MHWVRYLLAVTISCLFTRDFLIHLSKHGQQIIPETDNVTVFSNKTASLINLLTPSVNYTTVVVCHLELEL